MKILYFFEKKDTLMDDWQRFHIFDELMYHGISVKVINPLNYGDYSLANKAILNELEFGDFDLFMTPHNESLLFEATLKLIKNYQIPMLLICFDNLVTPYKHKNICSYYDLVWLTSIETESLFHKWGAKTIFLPYAANPLLFKPAVSKENNKVCFIGSPYGSRVNILNKVIESGIELDLYSKVIESNDENTYSKQRLSLYISPFLDLIRFSFGRKIILGAIKNKLLKPKVINRKFSNLSLYPPLPVNEIAKAYSQYSIALATTEVRNTGVLERPLHIVNLRSFEIPMSGGIQICKYSKELANYFEDGKEIILYKDDKELIEKLEYYLLPENKSLRDDMKVAARLRAEKEHSWIARFKLIFERLGLNY